MNSQVTGRKEPARVADEELVEDLARQLDESDRQAFPPSSDKSGLSGGE